ncbi:hypothetical protein G210_3829, partial [Candida maltosa Xu316]
IATDLTDDEEAQEQEQEKKSDTEERPDFYQIVGEEISQSPGPLAIASCAHGSMVDDVRKAVVDFLGTSPYRVELFEQMQNM